MGRLPSSAILTFGTGGGAGGVNNTVGSVQQASHALQPACLIVLTDGNCLRCPPSEGGGPLQLQLGGSPLLEFYHERKWRLFLFIHQSTLRSDKRAVMFCQHFGGIKEFSASRCWVKRLTSVTPCLV